MKVLRKEMEEGRVAPGFYSVCHAACVFLSRTRGE